MFNENLQMTGALTVEKNGEVVRKIKNLVVTGGKELVANRLAGSGDGISYMAVGTSSTLAVPEQTALVTEIDRNALTVANGTVLMNAVEYSSTWLPGDGTGALTEAGLFTSSTGGIMLARTVFGVVNKDISDTITITWTVTIS